MLNKKEFYIAIYTKPNLKDEIENNEELQEHIDNFNQQAELDEVDLKLDNNIVYNLGIVISTITIIVILITVLCLLHSYINIPVDLDYIVILIFFILMTNFFIYRIHKELIFNKNKKDIINNKIGLTLLHVLKLYLFFYIPLFVLNNIQIFTMVIIFFLFMTLTMLNRINMDNYKFLDISYLDKKLILKTNLIDNLIKIVMYSIIIVLISRYSYVDIISVFYFLILYSITIFSINIKYKIYCILSK